MAEHNWQKMVRSALQVIVVATFLGPAVLLAQTQELYSYKSLKPGDWALYKSGTKQVVIEVTETKVIVERITTTVVNGKPIGEPLVTTQTLKIAEEDRSSNQEELKPTSVSEEIVEVNGKQLACKVYKWEAEYGGKKYVTIMWISEVVPFGTVKLVSNDMVAMELVDWGWARD